MKKLELSPKDDGYYSGYNSSMEPNIANNFAASAFRFAHTLLPVIELCFHSNTILPNLTFVCVI